MAKYFIQDTTLTNIANAIREKTGGTAQLFPENMPGKIRGITSGNADTTGIDQGVVDEANRVASSINNKKAANSITFIAISDMHELGDSDSSASTISTYRLANTHAGQGAELVAKQISPDFFINLGDMAWGADSTTVRDLAQSITNARVYTAGLMRLTKCFATPGNHDIGYPNGNFDENIVDGMIGNYQYVDFDSKKIRVIIANTSDISDGTDRAEGVSGEQLQWFANALDLSSKTDAASWRIIIFSHHPLDWNSNTMPLANCVAAYVNATTYTATHDGLSISKSYSGKNKATIIGAFHGHVHCFKVAKLSPTTDAKPVQRIAIPNACNGRNNEYGRNGNLTFGEPSADTCPSGNSNKSTVAGQDTAFCVVTIDLDEEVIYADCFGSLGDTAPGSHAGYDRTISYGVEEVIVYTITNMTGNYTNDNGASTITAGSSYQATISALTGYEINNIKVTMGGVDITSSAVSGNNISIGGVTGDIVITVTTTSKAYTNLVPKSINADGSIYNGTGYKEGYRLNSSGTETALSGAACSGYIPYKIETIRVWGTTNSNKSTTGFYVALYDANFTKIDVFAGSNATTAHSIEAYNNKYLWIINPANLTDNATLKGYFAQASYIRVSMPNCSGADLIVTLNDDLQDPTDGENTVVTYKNWLPISTDENGNVFNGKGYETGKRFNSSGGTSDNSAYAITGFIPAKLNDVVRLDPALWNASGTHNSYMQIKLYDATKTALYAGYVSLYNGMTNGYFAYETDANGNHKITLNSSNVTYKGYYEKTAYIRLSVMASACADGIITVNEEIT